PDGGAGRGDLRHLRHAARGHPARRGDAGPAARRDRPLHRLAPGAWRRAAGMTGSVLIVDDSLTVRMNLGEIRDAAGLSTTACASGMEARKALAADRFSLVILDVLLPDADGVELLKEIRADPEAGGTAVMLLSTEAEVRHRIRGL